MREMMRRSLGPLGAMLVLGILAVCLAGCGESSQPTGPDGSVEPLPPVNPAPGALEPETGLE